MKKVGKIVLVVAGLLVAFIGGNVITKVGANSNWTNEIISETTSRLNKTAESTKQDLIQKNDIGEFAKASLQDEIDSLEEELSRLMEEYYQMKLEGIKDSETFQSVQNRIQEIKEVILDRYRKQIDQLFESEVQ